ncbi:NAD(P)-dependent alcohol dehydrogenase [Streptomyces sp. GQFP]|uniref:NAD(P)-dependent alcohol dehydrogenase n=1 Tax=Streptomyces sp. GQFP TaxID=2907545 RepID=UPI001F3E7DBC|nr:NAD(P)-dependent alcohol dehydrogenase [Streptomyces sp. GQFP]UIX31945.1 NAD(P)-dependent alcohol dehydrogenase [Streptomyces sp. GQFP]
MAIDIRAAVAEEKGKPFTFDELELDEPGSGEVLVKIVASGICQTDAHVWHQHLPTPLPAVLGHEGSGIVERVGSGVTSVRPGDHVVLSYQACGHCEPCLAGRYPYCDQAMAANFSGARLDGTVGVHRRPGTPQGEPVHGHFFGQSSFATYALTTERNTAKVPGDLPLELLAPLGCGLQTGAGAVLNSLKVEAGSAFAVFGTGAVGLAAVMAAGIAGASTIIGVDVNEQRLELAKELGATHTINALKSDVTEEIRRITGRGVNNLLDTTGRNDMLQHAVESLAPLGELGLVASAGTDATVPATALSFGKSVRGIVQGDAVPQLFIPQLVEHYRAGRFPFDKLVRFFPFEEINEAFAAASSGEVIKPILRIAQP